MGKASYGCLPLSNYRTLLYLILPEFARMKGLEPLNVESIKKLYMFGDCSKNTPRQHGHSIFDEINGDCTLLAFKNLIMQELKEFGGVDKRAIYDKHLLLQVLDQINKFNDAPQTSDKRLMPYINLV